MIVELDFVWCQRVNTRHVASDQAKEGTKVLKSTPVCLLLLTALLLTSGCVRSYHVVDVRLSAEGCPERLPLSGDLSLRTSGCDVVRPQRFTLSNDGPVSLHSFSWDETRPSFRCRGPMMAHVRYSPPPGGEVSRPLTELPELMLDYQVYAFDLCGPSSECPLPPLDERQVRAIAEAFLEKKAMNDAFRRSAERRVTAVGCHYEYEEAEKLDSFGVGIVVEIDRSGDVIDYYSSE